LRLRPRSLRDIRPDIYRSGRSRQHHAEARAKGPLRRQGEGCRCEPSQWCDGGAS
jgi:hypothetical protein